MWNTMKEERLQDLQKLMNYCFDTTSSFNKQEDTHHISINMNDPTELIAIWYAVNCTQQNFQINFGFMHYSTKIWYGEEYVHIQKRSLLTSCGTTRNHNTRTFTFLDAPSTYMTITIRNCEIEVFQLLV